MLGVVCSCRSPLPRGETSRLPIRLVMHAPAILAAAPCRHTDAAAASDLIARGGVRDRASRPLISSDASSSARFRGEMVGSVAGEKEKPGSPCIQTRARSCCETRCVGMACGPLNASTLELKDRNSGLLLMSPLVFIPEYCASRAKTHGRTVRRSRLSPIPLPALSRPSIHSFIRRTATSPPRSQTRQHDPLSTRHGTPHRVHSFPNPTSSKLVSAVYLAAIPAAIRLAYGACVHEMRR
ncbi:hypothetical protein IWZ01DRAFT_72575 [Phyllosticta capitalensis]